MEVSTFSVIFPIANWEHYEEEHVFMGSIGDVSAIWNDPTIKETP